MSIQTPPQSQIQPQPQIQQQQPQQQQPVTVYPKTVTGQRPPSHHSNESFGMVFIVLAVIIVISAIACFLGRLCNRRKQNKQKPPTSKQSQPKHHIFRPRERESDIEFGFEKGFTVGRPTGHRGDPTGAQKQPSENGRVRGEGIPAHNVNEPKAGQIG